MATLQATLWRRAFEAFERLLEIDRPSRESHLAQLATTDPAVHAYVVALLVADESTRSSHIAGASRVAMPLEPRAGTTIDAYLLERELGSGGMGEVWLAKRLDGVSDAPVALKLLHAHLSRSGARERFLREGRILGELTHPNVARLLDAGISDDGQPFLVLEYVEGERLDRWCEQRTLDINARVTLFLQVCDAVTHAHAHLVVHRDLKPSNVLVSEDGEVKLLDFGIATLVLDQGASAAESDLTRESGRALTPEYAAPEQITGAPVTVATDVYSLGVMLYVLLCGQRPYGVTGQSQSELEREVLQSEPGPPSAVARIKALEGDLDTIVIKALKKNPAERYASVAALADDLQRYLDHRPVLARPDSFAYRARKYLQRHRVGMSAAAVALLALVAGLSVALWQGQIARAQRARAEHETARAVATKDFLVSLFRASDPRNGSDKPRGQVTARELLDLSAPRIEKQFADDPDTQIELLDLFSTIYLYLGDADRASELTQRHVDRATALFGELDPRTLESQLLQIWSARQARDGARMQQLLERLDGQITRAGQDQTWMRAEWWLARGDALGLTGADAASQHQAVETAVRLYRQNAPTDAGHVPALVNLGTLELEAGDARAALVDFDEALAVFPSTNSNDVNLARIHVQRALALEKLGEIPTARHEIEMALHEFGRSSGLDHKGVRDALEHARRLGAKIPSS